MEEHGINAGELLRRHASGDRGDLDDEDRRSNDEAVRTGGRIFSAYGDGDGRLWLITEAEDDCGVRSATTYLRPEDY